MATVSCEIEYSQTGGKPGNGYGSNRLTSNTATLYYYQIASGSKWGSNDILTSIIFVPKAGLTKTSGNFSSSGSVSVSWYMTLTCNGITIRYPTSGNKTESYPCYAGNGDPYCGFIWSYGQWITITDPTFLQGVKNNSGITCKYYFPNNSNYCVTSNAYGAIMRWVSGVAPTTPTFNYPVASKITYNTKPRFSMKGTDGDGNTLTYQYSMDNSTWTNLATGVSSGTPKEGQVSTAQSTGSKTLYIRTYDGTAYSTVASRSFTIGSTSLGVSAGGTIDDATIDNAQSYITNLASYYGNSAPSWTTCNAGTKLNLAQITELNTRLKALTPAQSFTVPSAGSAIAASTFNTTINNAIKNS